MNLSLPVDCVVADRNAFADKSERRLRAEWTFNGTVRELGDIVSFNAAVSAGGSRAAITMAWPREKNPRLAGDWSGVLAPNDGARVTVWLSGGDADARREARLFTGVMDPDGIVETYSAQVETIDIRLEDVTGVAMRRPHEISNALAVDLIDPHSAAKSALGAIPFVLLFPVTTVGGCLDVYPNALMASDDVLIRRQEAALPLRGRRRMRYGGRDGWIIYAAGAEPRAGGPFEARYPAAEWDFMFDGRSILAGMTVDPRHIRFSTATINPYVDIGSRVRVSHPPASIGETAEVEEINWAFTPRTERMTLKCLRQATP